MTGERKSDTLALNVAPRLAYVSPKLSLLGDLCGLTETGSGANVENDDNMGGCVANATMQMC